MINRKSRWGNDYRFEIIKIKRWNSTNFRNSCIWLEKIHATKGFVSNALIIASLLQIKHALLKLEVRGTSTVYWLLYLYRYLYCVQLFVLLQCFGICNCISTCAAHWYLYFYSLLAIVFVQVLVQCTGTCTFTIFWYLCNVQVLAHCRNQFDF